RRWLALEALRLLRHGRSGYVAAWKSVARIGEAERGTRPALPGAAAAPALREPAQRSRRVTDVLRLHADGLHHRREEIRDRRFALIDEMPARPLRTAAAADEQRRQLVVRVVVAVGEAAAVDDQRALEQGLLAVRRALQLVDQLCEELGMV